MEDKLFKKIFFILAGLVWTSSFWGYKLFFLLTRRPYSSRFLFMHFAIIAIFIFTLGHLVMQILLHRKDGFRLKIKKFLFNIIGFALVGFCALLVSIVRDNRWGLVSDFFMGNTAYTLKTLIPLILAGEGIDIFFFFFVALISGYFIYYRVFSPAKFTSRDFRKVLVVWFFIVFINEMVIQRFFIPYRSGTVWDVFNNMIGVLVGFTLSMKCPILSIKSLFNIKNVLSCERTNN